MTIRGEGDLRADALQHKLEIQGQNLRALYNQRRSAERNLAIAKEALRKIVKIDATSSYKSIYTCPTEMAGIARDALCVITGRESP